MATASLRAPGPAQASVHALLDTKPPESALPGRPDLPLPGDRHPVDAHSRGLRGQTNGRDKAGVSTRFSVQDVSAGDRWVARGARGTAVSTQERSSFLVTGLINGHTYRWSMTEQAGGMVSPATAWNTFIADSTVVSAARMITSPDCQADGRSLAGLVGTTFRWSDTSREVNWGDRLAMLRFLIHNRDHFKGRRLHQYRLKRAPDIETHPVRDVSDLLFVRRKPTVAGVINPYHHAA